MKYFLSFFITCIILLSSISAFSAEKKNLTMIESILFHGEENGVEVVQIQLNGASKPHYFEIPGEKPRLVFDFQETGYSANLKKVIAADGHIVKKIRVGEHIAPVAKTRVVIDLVKDVTYEVSHSYPESANTLNIQIFKSITDVAEKIKENITQDQDIDKKQIERTSVPDSEEFGETIQPTEEKISGTETVPQALVNKPSTDDSSLLSSGEGDAIKQQSPGDEIEDVEINETSGKDIPVLLNVSFESSTNDKEMVLFKLNGFHPPVVFSTKEDELLVVCDFLDTVLGYGVEQLIETSGKYIDKVKVNKLSDPEKVRVVIELTGKYNYDLKQVFFKEDNLFVIIISNLGEKKKNTR